MRANGPLKGEVNHNESFQLFVSCESDRVRVVLQEESEKFLLPDLPSIRVLLGRTRMLRSTPEVFPSRATLVDPQGGVGTAADAPGAFDKVMCQEPRESQQAARFGVMEHSLELLAVDSWFEVYSWMLTMRPMSGSLPSLLLWICDSLYRVQPNATLVGRRSRSLRRRYGYRRPSNRLPKGLRVVWLWRDVSSSVARSRVALLSVPPSRSRSR